MQSRVPSFRRNRCTMPACLGDVAALALLDQHEPGGSPSFRGQLQASPGDQGEGLFWLRDHQPDAFGTQRFLGRPKQVGFIQRTDEMQPLPDTFGQTPEHRLVRGMPGNDPDQGLGMSGGLQQCEAATARTFGLMDPVPG